MPDEPVTTLLDDAAGGDPRAADRLMAAVYERLRSMAEAMMGRGSGQTLQPTALVNEAYLKLIGGGREDWAGRTHFFAVAATAMRQILIDQSRRRGAQKRGGDRHRITLDGVAEAGDTSDVDAELLGQALEDLAAQDQRAARVVELRFFAGMTTDQISTLLGVSERTVRNDWRHARAWLALRLDSGTPETL